MQRLNHHHLYLFWIFGKTESVTKSAKELSIAQSAVTSQLRQLEEALSMKLIDRSNPRRPTITFEGRKVLEFADTIFESSRELINWATHGALNKQQSIRIGAISGLSRNLQYEFIKPLLGKKEFKYEITTGDQKNLLHLLGEHQLDVVLTSQNVSSQSHGHFYSSVLTSSPVVFVCKKNHGDKKSSSLVELLKKKDLFIPGKYFEARPELDAYLENLNSQLRIAGEIDDIALLRILALRSDALVAVPEMGVKNDIEKGDLKVISVAPKIQQRFYAVTKHRLNPNDHIINLIKNMRD